MFNKDHSNTPKLVVINYYFEDESEAREFILESPQNKYFGKAFGRSILKGTQLKEVYKLTETLKPL